MEALNPAYLNALAAQIGSMSAFLGGFAATALTALLALKGEREKPAGWAIGLAAVSAVAFIIAVVASTMIAAATHPLAPASVARLSPDAARSGMALAFFVGLLTLLACIGASGWTRSRRLGVVTTAAAGIGFLVAAALLVSF